MVQKQYDDIFEAIRHYEPNSPLLNIKENRSGHIKRNLSYSLMEMPNGRMAALPKNFSVTFYRGENDNYDLKYPCKPNIFRGNPDEDELLINRLKIIEFSLILRKHPKIKYAEQDGMDIHYDALAQHYELKTDLLDLTSDIAVAAFFATHNYDEKRKSYIPIAEGVGCIRCYKAHEILTGDLGNMRLIGLQPFKRPSVQCAFGIKLKYDEDFSTMSNKVLFKQNINYSKKINELFCNKSFNKLIPPEDDINDIAKNVKKGNKISKKAISLYCKQNKTSKEKICAKAKNNGYDIVNNVSYNLSRQRLRAIKRQMKDNPYGDVKIFTRLCCDPK